MREGMNTVFGRYYSGHAAYVPGTALLVRIPGSAY